VSASSYSYTDTAEDNGCPMPDTTDSTSKKRKRRYVDILKATAKRKPVGWQEVPMDIDRLNTSFARTQMTPEARLQSLT